MVVVVVVVLVCDPLCCVAMRKKLCRSIQNEILNFCYMFSILYDFKYRSYYHYVVLNYDHQGSQLYNWG